MSPLFRRPLRRLLGPLGGLRVWGVYWFGGSYPPHDPTGLKGTIWLYEGHIRTVHGLVGSGVGGPS